jgi:drug/metabolite transporter (DMT)-like permease
MHLRGRIGAVNMAQQMETAMKNWRLFAVLEGLSRTVGNSLQKYIGLVSSAELACVLAGIIGLTQVGAGFWGSTLKRLLSDRRGIAYSVALGFLATTVGTVLSVYTYMVGADLGARTLLVNASIIPAALMGTFFWRDPLGPRQWLGIGVFLVATWAMLGFPGTFSLEVWVWLSLIIALSQAVSEVLSRFAASTMNPWTHNFWVGASSIFFALVSFIIVSAASGTFGALPVLSAGFVVGSIALSTNVVLMISLRLWTYQGGGTIAVKKVLMPGTFMATAIFAGALFFGEPLYLGKFFGIAIWLVAVALIDRDVWGALRST